MPGDDITNLIAFKKNLLKPATRLRPDPAQPTPSQPHTIPSTVVTKPQQESAETEQPETELLLGEEEIEISPALEREICLTINRELHVSYCYFTMGGVYTRQGLKSFAGMCTRQEDFHRSMARELLHHLSSRGGKANLADIAEPGPSCSTASCAEAVRVSLRLEEWLLENFSTTQQVATQEDDISKDYFSALLLRQLDEVEDAEMLVSRVLFSPKTRPSWQERKYWMEQIPEEAKNSPSSASETSGIESDEEDTI
eukprot:TRINITY_DN38438_c0_g1_i1.p1 TRINITY_DN38438_c0_g1~~TRINITY_DN38438_c0_g1_i1.p1  ORF type:complete len:255 (-),score=76.99 TRINITY_DN38438_c0_g1_i1:80-844(-)